MQKTEGIKKIAVNPEYFEVLDACPWCGGESRNNPLWCDDQEPFKTVQCVHCGMVFGQTRLSPKGRHEYYKQYYNDIHQLQSDLVSKRDEMYKVEIKFIELYITKGKVLDVGCSGGEFLTCFNEDNWIRWGVEFGRKAVQVAQKKDRLQCST